MEIKPFTVADLQAALSSEAFWFAETLPITKHRALSFIHNPRADENDIVLWIAYQDKHVAGYIGILPDRIFVHRAVFRLGWLTSWWVDPHFATQGVGAVLLYKALNAYQQQVGVSGGSTDARKVLEASQKFVALNALRGLEVRLRFHIAGAVLRKSPAMRPFRLGFRIADVLMDEVVDLRSLFWKRRNALIQRLSFEYISAIDAETARFIQSRHQQDLTRKGKAEFDWLMGFPWILSAPSKDAASRRYFFSSLSERFLFLGVKVFQKNEGMIGFFILSVRQDRMQVVYSYFDNRNASSITAAAVYHALAMDVHTLSLYDERLIKSVSDLHGPYWSTRAVSRGFFLSRAFADMPLGDYRLHGGDGDFAFY
jgi:GNAT superfamily N-acetyltransferase